MEKKQKDALTGKAGVESILLELEKSRAEARNVTMEKIKKILDVAFGAKIPTNTDPELAEPASELAEVVGALQSGSGFPVRAEIEQAATKTATLNIAQYVRKRAKELRADQVPDSFLETLEDEIQKIVTPMLRTAIEEEVLGKRNDGADDNDAATAPDPTKLWENIGKLALGEAVFNMAVVQLVQANPNMAVLLAGAKFDAGNLPCFGKR